MGKQSYRDVSRQAWNIIQYLLLLAYYSIGISLRPGLAHPPNRPALVAASSRQLPLTYKVVQVDSQGPPTGNLGTPNGVVELNGQNKKIA